MSSPKSPEKLQQITVPARGNVVSTPSPKSPTPNDKFQPSRGRLAAVLDEQENEGDAKVLNTSQTATDGVIYFVTSPRPQDLDTPTSDLSPGEQRFSDGTRVIFDDLNTPLISPRLPETIPEGHEPVTRRNDPGFKFPTSPERISPHDRLPNFTFGPGSLTRAMTPSSSGGLVLTPSKNTTTTPTNSTISSGSVTTS